jgi:hypothetical protein
MKTNFFVFPSVLLVIVAMAATLLAQNSTKQKIAAQNVTTQEATPAAKQKTEPTPAARPAISKQKIAAQNVTTQEATSAAKQKTEPTPATPAARPAISNQKNAAQNITPLPSERHAWVCGGGSVTGPIYAGNCPGFTSATCSCINLGRIGGTRPTKVTEAGIEQ